MSLSCCEVVFMEITLLTCSGNAFNNVSTTSSFWENAVSQLRNQALIVTSF